MTITLLLINLILYVRLSNQSIVKGYGPYYMQSFDSGDAKSMTFYDIDIYPYQYIKITLSRDNPKETLKPIDEGKYYTHPYQLTQPDESRKTELIKDTEAIHVESGDGQYVIHFDGSKPSYRTVEMFFELLLNRDRIGIIQINVIPNPKYITSEDKILLDSSVYKELNIKIYMKEVRYTGETQIFCGSRSNESKYLESTPFMSYDTNIKYQILSKPTHENWSKDYPSVSINLTNNVLFGLHENMEFQCPESNNTRIILTNFKYEKFDGMHLGTKKTFVNYDKKTYYFIFRNVTVISTDVPKDTFEIDCFKEFRNVFGEVVKVEELCMGSKLYELTETIKILDLSKCNGYNSTKLSCTNKKGYGPHVIYQTKPMCDLTNPDHLEKDGISCTLFLNKDATEIRIHKDKSLSLRKGRSRAEIYYLEDPESMGLESDFKPIAKDIVYFDVSDKGDYLELTKNRTQSANINQVFILLEDESKILKNVVRIYIHNDRVSELGENNVIWELVPNSRNMKFSCSDWDKNYTYDSSFYPKGKNTVYRNVPNTEVDLEKLETVQFEELFGSSGITILKSPETDSDLEIIFDENYEITASHLRPIYFICHMTVKENFEGAGYKKNIIVSIDPVYKYLNYKGCGIREDIFVNSENVVKNDKIFEFDLKKDENVRFFCPDYVPEHFLEEDQEQYKSDKEDEDTENPFKSLVRCYDRSTFWSRFFKLKNEVDILEKRTSVSELRSLWKFDHERMKQKGINRALCVCYNNKGYAKSGILIHT
ncbi:hypothetical protein TpMuguga_02g00907 [Theileria parva strain Muguga]|uniref:6-Cys domain-containing protein n=1 Tax=Theileria parva TaxID=5875 RepID=Q4N3T1_THEPA|nr:uncharacterized protein TpMuguga_02g00907 [Theileria parva strain Muguga]EAN33192.1 hypothetical protein TpMuguga_02g00907 [Theileria parva strain Muguga]|eukprot:XP_765475.1 hypothetical protein [Theileria parva strain Muguga]